MILKSIDFINIRPELICVETVEFSLKNTVKKNKQIETYMYSQEYHIYADTNLNTLFFRSDLFT